VTNPVQVKTEEQMSFAWAREMAQGVADIEAQIRTAEDALSRCDRVLRETMEYRAVEAAKEKVADAKRDAIEGNADVSDAKDALKAARAEMKRTASGPLKAHAKARGDIKALREARDDAKDAVVRRLVGGA